MSFPVPGTVESLVALFTLLHIVFIVQCATRGCAFPMAILDVDLVVLEAMQPE